MIFEFVFFAANYDTSGLYKYCFLNGFPETPRQVLENWICLEIRHPLNIDYSISTSSTAQGGGGSFKIGNL